MKKSLLLAAIALLVCSSVHSQTADYYTPCSPIAAKCEFTKPVFVVYVVAGVSTTPAVFTEPFSCKDVEWESPWNTVPPVGPGVPLAKGGRCWIKAVN